MPFDLKSAVPVAEQNGVITKPPEFDINTALQITSPVDGEEGYDAFLRSQFHQQIKDSIDRPLSAGEARFIQDTEQQDPGAFRSFAIPYAESVIGFFTKPLGYRPTFEKPFGLEKGPKTTAEMKEQETMAKEHPVAFTFGQIVGGTAPFIATAPLFPQSLLGTLATFETVGLVGELGRQKTDESLMMPTGEKAMAYGREAVKSGILAPIWYFSGDLKFIGRPFLSAMTRAGTRGTATAGLEAVFGTDLGEALKQGGIITALSLMFESPYLAKTALGRGIIARANDIAKAKGFPEGKYTIDVDALDAVSTKANLFDLVKGFYKLMRVKIEKVGQPIDPAKQATYDRLTYASPEAPPETPGEAGGTIWAPVRPEQPKAGGMAFRPQKAPIFYSKMSGVLAEKMPESAPVDQVRGILQSSGIPKEEIEWSGIEEFLKGKDKVSKSELLNYLQKNQLTIEESIKEGTSYPQRLKQIEEIFTQKGFSIGKEMGGEILVTENATDRDIPPDELENTYPDLMELAGEYTALKGEFEKQIPKEMPKYADAKYNVVTDNYREILLRVPGAPEVSAQQENYATFATQRGYSEDKILDTWQDMSDPVYKEFYDRNLAYLQRERGYQEPHWDEPNVFAHARIADVTDSQGRKGLFINEVQSQWMLDARKKGFLEEGRLSDAYNNYRSGLLKKYGLPPDAPETTLLGKISDEEDRMLDELASKGTVPYHPVVTRWHEVILKRLLRYAAENGYDFISWATGEQVAGYYDLSKQIDAIEFKKFKPNKDWAPKGAYEVEIIKDDKVLESKTIEDPKELSDFIGKDNAQKIIDAKYPINKEGAIIGKISGKDLKVSPEWSKNLYDRQIPNWLNDYAKKFGAQVGSIKIPIRITKEGESFEYNEQGELVPAKEGKVVDFITQQSLAITPQMKHALLGEGQPVFGKMPKEVGIPGKEFEGMKIFRMDEEAKIVNTKGEIVTLPKGEEYRTLPVYDADGNLVPNKVKLVDGKQVTVYEGELNKLKGKLLGEGEQPMAGGMIHPPAPEEGQPPEEKPKQRVEQRKADMELWNTPDITNKLMFDEKEFLKKYIDEGKSLKEIAKELGEDIEDVKKTEMWTYAHMQEIADEMRAEIEEAGNEELLGRKKELKAYLSGQLDPALKQEEEYHDLAMLPWLWAPEGKGVRPDEIASEIADTLQFPVESESDVIELIKSYFEKEISGRAETIAVQESKVYAKKMAKLPKGRKLKAAKPEREITGVGNGSIISTKEDIDYEERDRIFKGIPFALLGNKAEVLARLPSRFKAVIKQGIKKVYDLWGGAKGYRVGLFSDIPAQDYILNELSDERYNYYKNIQDPEKQKTIKQELLNIMNDFVVLMKDAFGLLPAKDNKDFLDMLNSWLKMGLRKERYYFTREVIQEFGDKLLQEAVADKFSSPESSAKYYFLENASIFSITKTKEGYAWTQGIIRTTKGESAIKNIIGKMINFNEQLDSELKRDQGMQVMQSDAWQAMAKLTEDIRTGKVNAEETVVVLVDPQYLSPTESAGTYSVGVSDTSWKGHKQNLEQYLIPLVDTGVRIIYTNNADYELIKWLRANKLPYNINKAIGAIAERRGRDEIISFINFKFPEQYVSGVGTGAKWSVGEALPTGTGGLEPGQQYVTERLTGQSARFVEWMRKHELLLQEEVRKQELIAKIKLIAKSKMLSNITVSRIKKYLGIKEWKNTEIPQIQKVVDYLEGLKVGDRLLSEKQIKVLKGLLEDVRDLEIMPKRIAIEQFGNNPELLEGLVMSRVANELIPTVDIKEGHPLVQKILNEINEKLEFAEEEVRRRDNQLEEMLAKAEKSRKSPAKEKVRRFFTSQNKEIFRALSGEHVDLTKEETAVVAYLKNFFKMAKDKLALQKFRRNYITHLEQPLTEKILEKGLIGALRQYFREQEGEKGIPTDIMLELDNIIGSEKFFRFALQRKGGIEPTTNIRKIVHEYSSLFETKIALDRILPLGQVATQLIIQGRSALWLKKFLQNLKGRGLDYDFRSGKMGWLTKVADGIIDLGYIKLLSLNWKSAIKNLVAGEANSIIWQDFSVYLKGKQRFISDPKKAYKIAVEHGVLEGTYADYTQRGIGKLKKLQDLAMIGQQAGEVEIRTSLFISELTEQEWKTEEISSARSRKLRDIVAITQGIFSKTESPLWVQTALGRTIMQMNRWRITDAMLLRRIVNGAKEEWKAGEKNGENTQRLTKAILFYAIGMYVSYELAKAGFKKAAQIAQSMAEVVNGLVSLISQGDLKQMITDNPTLSVIKEFLFTAQEVTKYLHVPGAKKPKKVEFQQGIEETYIAPVNTIRNIIDELE